MSEAFESITVLMFALPRELVGSDQVEVKLPTALQCCGFEACARTTISCANGLFSSL